MSNDFIERIEWLHCLMQELEDAGVRLPMGDYGDVYNIIETIRDEVLGTAVDDVMNGREPR